MINNYLYIEGNTWNYQDGVFSGIATIIDANKKVDRVIGTADHIKTALDVLNKKGDEA